VIVEVGDTRSVLMDDGQPRRVGFEVKLKAYGEDETVTDYSGGWSPFAVLSVVDSVLTDPIGAIDDLLGSLPGLLKETGTGSVAAVTAIHTALKELLSTFGSSLNGLHSQLRSAGLTIPAIDPLVQQVITASNAPLSSSAALDTQITALLTAINALWTTAAQIQARIDPVLYSQRHSEIAGELIALLEKPTPPWSGCRRPCHEPQKVRCPSADIPRRRDARCPGLAALRPPRRAAAGDRSTAN